MKKLLALFAIASFLFVPVANASILGIATTADLQDIQNKIDDIQAQVTAIQHRMGGLGSIVINPTVLTSSTVAAAIPNPLTVGSTTIGPSVVQGGTNTSTLTGDGSTSYIPFIDSVYHVPSPTQLAAGVTCGASTGVTDFGTCVNADYLQGSANGSTTEIIAGPYQYNYSTPIVFGTQAELVYFHGSGGQGTFFNFAPTSGVAITLNNCNSNAKRKALQLAHFGLGGATTTVGATTGILAGGSNGACATTIDDVTIRTFSYDLHTSSNTYMLAVNNFYFSNAQQAIWQDTFSNSGEQMSYNNGSIVDPAATAASTTQYVLLDVNSSPSTEFNNVSFDNGGVQIAGGNTVTFINPHFENPTRGKTGYRYIDELSATNSMVSIFAGTLMNDATATAEAPDGGLAYANAGSYFNTYAVNFQRNGSATSTVYGVSNTNNTGGAKITMCNTIMNTTPFGTAPFKNGGISVTSNDGCLSGVNNNYPFGWNSLTSNKASFFGSSNGVDENTVGNINGTAGVYAHGFLDGTTQPSSSLEVQGTVGFRINNFSASTTIIGLENTAAPANGNFSYEFTGTDGSTVASLPATASTTNRIYDFTNRGTAKYSISVSSTDFINLGNVTSTSYTVTRGGNIMIQSDGTRWVVLSRSPQRYITAVSIGGAALLAGACTSTTTGVDTWIATGTADMATFNTTPTNFPTSSANWATYLSSNGVATTEVCVDVTATPTLSTYNFTVN